MSYNSFLTNALAMTICNVYNSVIFIQIGQKLQIVQQKNSSMLQELQPDIFGIRYLQNLMLK